MRDHVYYDPRLHLSVSMRSFRAEHVSQLVKYVLDLDETGAMVICVPPGDATDPTRDPSFYDPTFEYLKNIGFDILD